MSIIFAVHLDIGHHADWFGLRVAPQSVVAPEHIGIDHIFRLTLWQHECGDGTGVERCLLQLNAHQGVGASAPYLDGEERLGIANIRGIHRFDDFGIGCCHREDGRRKEVASELVNDFKIV